MTISQIKTFLTVAECMSFTEAASTLNLTQSAVSRQMATLEDEIGAKIFDRKNNYFRLTYAGRKLRDGFRQVVDGLDNVISEVQKIDRGIEGELRIGVLSDQSMDQVMTRALRRLSAEGNVDLVVTRLNFKGLYQSLVNGSIDVVNTIIHYDHFYPECEKLIYVREPMMLAVRKDLIEPPEAPLTLEQLDAFTEKVPIKAPSLDSYVESQRVELGMQFQRARTYNQLTDFESIIPLTSVGLCATIINRSHMLSINQDIGMYPLAEDDAMDKGLMWIPDNPNPVIGKFIALVKEEAEAPVSAPPLNTKL